MAETVEIENMIVRLMGDASSYLTMLKTSQTETTQAANRLEQATGRIEAFQQKIQGWGQSALGFLGSLGVSFSALGLAVKGVNLAAGAEQMEISFATMLGSADAGKRMVEDLVDFAAKTPMNMPGIQQGAKTLLQFGIAGADIIPTLRMIGDVTGGAEEPFSRLARTFGQMSATGRLMGNDLFEMVNAGFNPLMEMAQHTGKGMDDLKKEMEAGKISVAMVTESFKRATSAGGQFDGMMEKQSKSLTGLLSTMQDDLGAFLRVIGKEFIEGLGIKKIVGEISGLAQSATTWFKALDPEIKRIGLSILVIVGTIAGIAAGFTLLMPLLAPIIAVFSTWGILAVTLGAGLASMISGFIAKAGGMAKFFDVLKEKGAAFLAYIQPAIDWFIEQMRIGWITIQYAASLAFSAISTIITGFIQTTSGGWSIISDVAKKTWELIRDAIITALIMGEFAVLNFGKIVQHVWIAMQYRFIVLTETFKHFFTTVLPTYLNWFGDNWYKIFFDAARNGAFLIKNMVENIVNLITAIPDLIAGNIDLGDVWKPLARGMVETVDKLPNIPDRIMGNMETQLKKEFEQGGAALGKDFEAFKRERMKMFDIGADKPALEEAKKNAELAGKEGGDAYATAAGKAIKEVDAVLAGSTESFRRVYEYFDRIKKKPTETKPGDDGAIANAGQAAMKPIEVAQKNAGKDAEEKVQSAVLRRIATATEKMAAQKAQAAALELAEFGF